MRVWLVVGVPVVLAVSVGLLEGVLVGEAPKDRVAEAVAVWLRVALEVAVVLGVTTDDPVKLVDRVGVGVEEAGAHRVPGKKGLSAQST